MIKVLPHIVADQHYQQRSPIEKGWQVRYFYDEGDPLFEFKPMLLSHSTTWCMGSLNIDVFALSFGFWKWHWFVAYRIEVYPPLSSVSTQYTKNSAE